jgi:SOS response regulatory protein OraA/RecX
MSSYQEIKDKVLNKVLSFIAYSPRTVREVNDRLAVYLSKEDITPEEKEKCTVDVLEQIDGLSLLDDAKYASDYVNGRIRSGKSVSSMEIKKFLYSKGVDPSDIELALAVYTQDVETANIEELVDKKINSLKKYPPSVAKRKLVTYLLTKGYAPDRVYAVVDTKLSID